MGEPLPTNYVGVLYEYAVSKGFAGSNFGTHIAIVPEYDVGGGSSEAGFAGHVIAHEVAHYYWGGNRDWVDEGASDLMASISEGTRSGSSIETTNHPCTYVSNIAELERMDPGMDSDAYDCNYALGESFFLGLYHRIGHEQFRLGFRNLYLASTVEDPTDYYDEYEGVGRHCARR